MKIVASQTAGLCRRRDVPGRVNQTCETITGDSTLFACDRAPPPPTPHPPHPTPHTHIHTHLKLSKKLHMSELGLPTGTAIARPSLNVGQVNVMFLARRASVTGSAATAMSHVPLAKACTSAVLFVKHVQLSMLSRQPSEARTSSNRAMSYCRGKWLLGAASRGATGAAAPPG